MSKKLSKLLLVVVIAILPLRCTPQQKTQLILKEDSKLRKIYGFKTAASAGEAIITSTPSAEAAEKIMNSFTAGIKTSFETRSAPYAGHITANIDCVTRKYLKELAVPFGETKADLVLAVANDRRLSVCSLEQVKYLSGFWTSYNKKKQHVLTIKIFAPIAQLENVDSQQQDVLRTLQKIAIELH